MIIRSPLTLTLSSSDKREGSPRERFGAAVILSCNVTTKWNQCSFTKNVETSTDPWMSYHS